MVEGTRMTQQQVAVQLQEVLRDVDEYEGSDPPPVGIMTADNRRTWAQSRQILAGGELPIGSPCEVSSSERFIFFYRHYTNKGFRVIRLMIYLLNT